MVGKMALLSAAMEGRGTVVANLSENGAEVDARDVRILPTENDESICEDNEPKFEYRHLYASFEGHGGKAVAEFAAQKHPALITHGMSDEDRGKELLRIFQEIFGEASADLGGRGMTYVASLYNDADKVGGVLCTTDQQGCPHLRQTSTDPKIGNKNQHGYYQVLEEILNGNFTVEVVRHKTRELEAMGTGNGDGQATIDSLRRFYLKFMNQSKICERNANMTWLLQLLNSYLRGHIRSSAVPPLPPERLCSFITVTLLAGPSQIRISVEESAEPGDHHSSCSSIAIDSSCSSIANQEQKPSGLDAQLSHLPTEVLEKILLHVPLQYLSSCAQVCKTWKAVMRSLEFWKKCKEKDPEEWNTYCHYDGEFDDVYAIRLIPSPLNCKVFHTKSLDPFLSGDVRNFERFCPSLEVLTYFQW